MKTTFTVSNEQALDLEMAFHEFLSRDLLDAIENITEKSFHTHFVFNDLSDEEEFTIQNLIDNL